MTVKRISAAIIAFMLIFSLASCTGDSSEIVISAEGTSSADISANMYNYWVSTGKANFMYSYSDIEDTDDFWNSEYTSGITYAEFLDELLLSDIKITAVCMMLYNENRLSVSEEVKNSIEEEIDEYLQEYADGNKNTFNMVLSKYGANMTILESIKLQEAKRSIVMEYFFGDDGEMALVDSDKEEYYQENYYHIQIIYINNKYEYVVDSDGNYTTNADGTYVTRALTGDKLAEKNSLIEAATEALAIGEDFDSVFEKYSEMKEYSNGYYLSPDYTYVDDVFYKLIGDAAGLPEGDIKTVEYDAGTYIIKKLPLEEGAWNDAENVYFFASFDALAKNSAFRKFAESYFDKLNINDSIISSYSVRDVMANSRF